MPVVDKRAVATAFGRAADAYDSFAVLQHTSGERLLTLAKTGDYPRVLDAGCGTGTFSRRWRERGSRVTALDISPVMLNKARSLDAAHTFVAGDIEALPLPDAHFDLVWSNLAVQWCSGLSHALDELLRVTRPGGTVLFSTLCDGSLSEVAQAWKAVDARLHVNRFLTHEQVTSAAGDSLTHGLCEPITLYFPDALSAMRSLKGTGATHLHEGRDARLLTRGQLQTLSAAWPQHEGKYPLTYHLFYGVLERG